MMTDRLPRLSLPEVVLLSSLGCCQMNNFKTLLDF